MSGYWPMILGRSGGLQQLLQRLQLTFISGQRQSATVVAGPWPLHTDTPDDQASSKEAAVLPTVPAQEDFRFQHASPTRGGAAFIGRSSRLQHQHMPCLLTADAERK